jgi:hypothetical protein
MSNTKLSSKMSNDTCCICCDTFTKERRAPVSCPKCSTQFCRACIQRYVLSQEMLTGILCMQPECDCVWTRAFLVQNTTSKFINQDFRTHKKELLFQHELSRMQDTMVYAESMKKLDKVVIEAKELRALRKLMQADMRVVQNKIYRAEGRMWQLRYGDNSSKESAGPARQFIKPCPANDCNGFLSTHWRCKVCDIQVCATCHEIKGMIPEGIKPTAAFPDHVCDPGNVATAQMLKKDSKNCPACGVTIHKTEGCNQMWCTNCNTAFSWRTGKRINGVVHNPHFFEWQRQNNGVVARTPGDIPCGGFPRWRDFSIAMGSTFTMNESNPAVHDVVHGSADTNSSFYKEWVPYAVAGKYSKMNILCTACAVLPPASTENPRIRGTCKYEKGCGRAAAFSWKDITRIFYRNVAHFNRIEMREYEEERERTNAGHGNRDLRARYILGKISGEVLKDNAIRRNLKSSKAIDIFNVFELMNNIGRESLISMMREPNIANIEKRFMNTYRVMDYCNNELKKISAVYNQSVPIIRADFYTQSTKFSKRAVFGK